MSTNQTKIAALLSDNHYHDGTSIGHELNVTRAAVWKAIKKLEGYGIPIKSVKGKGYLLEDPLILLDAQKITSLIRTQPIHLDVLEKTISTNDYLKDYYNQHKDPMFCIAETQTQGKGRLNRHWHSPFGQNIYLSALCPIKKDISELSGLSLVVGLAVSKAIEENCQIDEKLFVKWPNDVIANHKKIAGILIEIQAESHGYCNVIIGVGINVNMQQASKNQIDQQWASIRKLSGQYQDRNRLCAALIDQLLAYLQRFNDTGLSDFTEEWQSRDYLLKKPVRLLSNQTTASGEGAGINAQGHLILTLPNHDKQAFASGDTRSA